VVWADSASLANGVLAEIRGKQGTCIAFVILLFFLRRIDSTLLLTMTCDPQINLD